ncbi:uncharacterized protein N7529_001839 [Penicillium soppii]|uniref:uncharacterized protein n=1 Tax=Penicillium soppii TaxID=69789 RepID=UPI0025482E0B|nr:uncharacterized protein N7529_001839 [Penicillium soppii]KAJ5876255.1 hypothetical protein N7529_001839 [Penicillium soppii]
MAPNQRIIPSGSRPQKSFFSTAYNEATNPENKTIVRSIIVFGRYCVPFLQPRRVPPSSAVCNTTMPLIPPVTRLGSPLEQWKHIGVGQRKTHDA